MSPFSWLLFLDVADNLITSGSEAHLRSAASRAYYAVFGEIRGRLERQGIRFRRANVHQEVIGWLRSQHQTDIAQIGVDLDRLRRQRNHADYDAGQGFARQHAQESLLRARSIESQIPVHLP